MKNDSNHEINLKVAKLSFDSDLHDIVESKGSFSWFLKYFKEQPMKVFVSNADFGSICTTYREFNPCENWDDVNELKTNHKIDAPKNITQREFCELYLSKFS